MIPRVKLKIEATRNEGKGSLNNPMATVKRKYPPIAINSPWARLTTWLAL
jgi:hypothetical protein